MIPLRFHEIGGDPARLVFTTDAGRSFIGSPGFLEDYVGGRLSSEREAFLAKFGPPIGDFDGLNGVAYALALAKRHHARLAADYFILVPTLRCNLDCSYCQVSRAPEHAKGFDWSQEVADAAIDMIVRAPAQDVKLEFQGGEPTLRLDLVEYVIERVKENKASVETVICTNMLEMSPRLLSLLERAGVHISTSVDGSLARQARQRTKSESGAQRIFDNVDWVIKNYGVSRISALPTIDIADPPSYDELYEAFVGRGLHSLYLRPVNYQGFARKRHGRGVASHDAWIRYHIGFVRYLVERGGETNYAAHEFHVVHLLKRIFHAGENGHVDLRNPGFFGADYLLIDHDGRIFPTDEARMLDRIGEADLSIGDVFEGVDIGRARALNEFAFNDDDPDCIHCAFQPYCGSDPIDSISRYGRIDAPRRETVFCRTQTALFDFAFDMLAAPAPEERKAVARWLDLPQEPARFLETAP